LVDTVGKGMTARNSFEVIKYGLRPGEAGEALGGAAVLGACEEAKWIKPVIHRHKLKVYARADIAKCWLRIERSESPFSVTNTIPGGIQPKRQGRRATNTSNPVQMG